MHVRMRTHAHVQSLSNANCLAPIAAQKAARGPAQCRGPWP
eukprot:CAMPEP_0206493448 /NCGR_PEP_ID=MMETSP0324_2-20121206/46979_1 /ASSEMBLY_ACC=CAM_ASM_000836 /TAXON_ID=2866 /ORGANISM="Crypthecodinium cohnii, Strain Seligo" /LENGTH=40 /DNA_ID= /DNA_START= /DNA_END= /DNA_ORIENTATION=